MGGGIIILTSNTYRIYSKHTATLWLSSYTLHLSQGSLSC